jgi:Ion transport protein
MIEAGTQRKELKNTGYEIFVGILSILSIVNIVLLYAVDDPNLDTVLFAMNGLLSAVFVADFVYRLVTAESKAHYFLRQFGWADLLASLPFEQVKILRVFRLVRVFRLLRAYGVSNIARSLIKDRAGSALLTLLLMGILVLEFGSLEILHLEQYAPGANITSASDALWYVIVTISTVGYGDRFPVTNVGRLVGVWLMIVGVGLFGTFTAFVANAFVSPHAARPAAPDEHLRAMVREQQQMLRDLSAQVAAATGPADTGSEVVVAGEPPECHVAPGGRDIEGDEAVRQGRRHRRL